MGRPLVVSNAVLMAFIRYIRASIVSLKQDVIDPLHSLSATDLTLSLVSAPTPSYQSLCYRFLIVDSVGDAGMLCGCPLCI